MSDADDGRHCRRLLLLQGQRCAEWLKRSECAPVSAAASAAEGDLVSGAATAAAALVSVKRPRRIRCSLRKRRRRRLYRTLLLPGKTTAAPASCLVQLLLLPPMLQQQSCVALQLDDEASSRGRRGKAASARSVDAAPAAGLRHTQTGPERVAAASRLCLAAAAAGAAQWSRRVCCWR